MTTFQKPAPWHLSRVSTLLERRPVPEPVRELAEAQPDGTKRCGHWTCSCGVIALPEAPEPEPRAPFVVGQRIECIDNTYVHALTVGSVYEIESVIDSGKCQYVHLLGMREAGPFDVIRFVPAAAPAAAGVEWADGKDGSWYRSDRRAAVWERVDGAGWIAGKPACYENYSATFPDWSTIRGEQPVHETREAAQAWADAQLRREGGGGA